MTRHAVYHRDDSALSMLLTCADQGASEWLGTMVSEKALLRRYGLVYPGVGWVIFRSKDYLPESLVFHDNYL